MANEGIVESGLPFLNEGHFKAAIVCPVCINWDRSPDVQVIMILPIATCQFGLDKPLVGELKVFSGAAILSVESTVHCRAHIKFGLQIGDMSETRCRRSEAGKRIWKKGYESVGLCPTGE